MRHVPNLAKSTPGGAQVTSSDQDSFDNEVKKSVKLNFATNKTPVLQDDYQFLVKLT